MNKKIVFVPGNGNSTTKDNWFPKVKSELEFKGMKVVAADFPDPDLARRSIWIPYLINELKVDQNTFLIGHSFGAVAALKLAEEFKILGSVLIGAYYTDLNIVKEKKSEYFDSQWLWKKIKDNQKFIILFGSQNDPWIPVNHPRYIHKKLECEYHEYKDQGHFGGDYFKLDFPEITQAILRNISTLNLIKT